MNVQTSNSSLWISFLLSIIWCLTNDNTAYRHLYKKMPKTLAAKLDKK